MRLILTILLLITSMFANSQPCSCGNRAARCLIGARGADCLSCVHGLIHGDCSLFRQF